MAGYSGTPLAKKLGIREGHVVLTKSAPSDFRELLEPLPAGVSMRSRGDGDVAVVFFTRAADVTKQWPSVTTAVGPEGVVWVAWPKKSSGVATDLTEDRFRDLLLPTGWVDVKVCAIDATWSGLKFVLRKELRPR
jgi:hypothetical protein